MDLSGKAALVTGAAHRLGKAIALALARRGASIVVHYGRSAVAAEETVRELEALGVRAWPIAADLADPAAIEHLFAEVAARAGRLDVLVNCAASFEREAFDRITVEAWDRVLAVNVRAPFLCIQNAARLMRQHSAERGAPGAVISILDLSAELAWPGYAHHGAAKAGLAQLTRIAARELAPVVRVNAVELGAILPIAGESADTPEWRAIGERLPLRRTGEPRDVGAAVVFLAESDFITGVTLPVEGGEALIGAGHRPVPP